MIRIVMLLEGKTMNGSLSSAKATPMKKSTYNIKSFVHDDIIEIIVTGDIAKPNTREIMMQKIIDVEKNTNVKKQLLDFRKLSGRLGILEIYTFVRDYHPYRHLIRVALIDTLEHAATASFHETTARNAGLSFRWFTDINEARMWLKSKSKKLNESNDKF